MRPGVTSAPVASISSSPSGERRSPISAMTPSRTRTSARRDGPPVPSTKAPPRTSTSRMTPNLRTGVKTAAGRSVVARIGHHRCMQAGREVEPRVVAGRYELRRRLGAGGMAEVREANDHRLGRMVAVKLLRFDLAEQPSARRRFEAEARAAARLSHPNIVTVFDTGEDHGQPFLVMERLPGRTLAHEIHDGPLSLARAVDVTVGVLAALSEAHAAGILHRDVKPGNV